MNKIHHLVYLYQSWSNFKYNHISNQQWAIKRKIAKMPFKNSSIFYPFIDLKMAVRCVLRTMMMKYEINNIVITLPKILYNKTQ